MAINTGKIIPLRDYVALIPDQAEEKIGNWDVAETAQKRPKRGKVIAVGTGEVARDTGKITPMTVKIGDTVHYSKFAGTELELNGELVILVHEAEILGIIGRDEEFEWLGVGVLKSENSGI